MNFEKMCVCFRPPPQKPTSGIKRPMPRQPPSPTTGGKCPRMRVPVQEDPECSRCEEFQLENELLKQQLDEIINNKGIYVFLFNYILKCLSCNISEIF